MTVHRSERPATRAEEVAIAEARDLPPRTDGADRREPLADVKGRPSSHAPRDYDRDARR